MPTLEELMNQYKEIEKEKNTPSLSPFNDTYNTANSKLSEIDANSAKTTGILGAVDRTTRNPLHLSEKEYNDYVALGITPTPYQDYEKVRDADNAVRALNQSVGSKIINSIAQGVISEIGLGSIQGVVDILAAPFELFEGENRDWNNPISTEIQKWRDSFNKSIAPIYRKNPDAAWDVDDVGWWASNFPSVLSSLSLFLPSWGITKGLGKIGGLLRAEKAADKATSLGKAMGYNKVSGFLGHQIAKKAKEMNIPGWKSSIFNAQRVQEFGNNMNMALLSRVAENSQEAREVYKSGKEDAEERLNKMSNEEFTKFTNINPEYKGKSKKEIAEDIARQAADGAFTNDMGLILFDLVQLYGIGNLGKLKPNMAANSRIRSSFTKELNALEKAGANATTGAIGDMKLPFKTRVTDFLKTAGKTFAEESTEGVEEGFQGIQQQKGSEFVRNKFEDIAQYKTLSDYIVDPEITSQAFWGWLGGIMFGGGANIISKAANNYKLKQDIKDKNLSDIDIRRRKYGMDAARIEDIESWRRKYDELKKNVTTITNGHLPDTHPEFRNEDGSERELSVPEINYYKQQFIESFISDLAVDAASNGNAGLLYEWVEDPRVQQYLKANGMEEYAALTKETMQNAVNDYADSLESIYSNVSNVKPGIADTLARQMVKAKRNRRANEKLIAGLQEDYANLKAEEAASDKNNWKDEYETYISVQSQLDSIRHGLNILQKLETNLNDFIKKAESGDVEVTRDKLNSRVNIESEINSFKKEVEGRIAYIESLPFTGEQFVKNRDSIINALHELRDSINNIDINAALNSKTKQYNAFANISDFTKQISDIEAQYFEVKNDFDKTQPSEQLKSAYLKLNRNRKDAYIADRQLAMSKAEMKEAIGDIEASYMFLARNLNNEYRDIIKKYLEKADNVDEAFSKLIAGQYDGNKNLEEAMNFYDIGRGSRFQTSLDILNLVNDIKKKREENTKNNTVGKDTNNRPKPTEEVQKETDTLEKAKDVSETNIQEQTPKEEDTKEEQDADVITNKEVVDEIADELKEAAEQYKQETLGLGDEMVSDGYIPSQYELQVARITSLITNYINEQTGEGSIVKYFVALSRDNSDAVDAAVNEIANDIFNKHDKVLESLSKEQIANLIIDAIQKKVSFSESKRKRQGQLTSSDVSTITLVRNVLASYVFTDVAEGTNDDGTQASSFRSIEDKDRFKALNEVLKRFADEAYPDYIKNSDAKLPVDVERFLKYVFNTLATNGQLNLETYQGICRYIEILTQVAENNNDSLFISDKFILNDASNILGKYKNNKDKTDFIKELLDKFAINTEIENASQIDRGFRFVIHKNLKNRNLLLNLANKKLYCRLDKNGNVELCYDAKDGTVAVGFLGKVAKVGDNNTGYALTTTSKNKYSINSEVEKVGKDQYRLKNDTILRELISSKDLNVKKVLTALSEYYILSNKLKTGTVSTTLKSSLQENDRQKKLRIEVLKTALGDGGDFLSRYLDSVGASDIKNQIKDILKIKNKDGSYGEYKDLDSINSQDLYNIFASIATSITDILYYDSYKASFSEFQRKNNKDNLLNSLNRFAKNVYDNFELTYKIQEALQENSGKQVTVDFNQVGTYNLNFDRSAKVPIKDLKIASTAFAHPLIVFKGSQAISENGVDKFENKPGFADDTIGILLSSNSTNPMVAVLNKSSYFGDNKDEEIYKALHSYVQSAIKEYFDSPADIKSYNKLLDTFTNLFKNGSVFKGYDLSILNGGFTINRAVTRTTESGATTEWEPVVSFYKYRAKAVNETDASGNPVTNYYEINPDGSRGEKTLTPKVSKFTVMYDDKKIITKNITDKLLNKLTDSVVDRVRVSDRFITNSALGIRQNNNFVTFDKKGTGFTIKIGDTFNKHYTNFSEFIVRNNLFTTTHVGRTARTMFNSMDREDQIKTVDSGIRTKVTILSDKEASAAVETFKDKLKKKVAPNAKTTETSTKEALELAGFNEEEIERINNLNDNFEEGKGIIPTSIKFNFTYKVSRDLPVYGTRNKNNTITYYAAGMDLVDNVNKNEFLRLLIHEQFHKNLADSKFFEGEIGTARVNHIIEIFDSFNTFITNNQTNDNYSDIYNWLNNSKTGWYTKYKAYKEGNVKDLTSEKAKAKFANEFLAEVYSNSGLLDALNSIDYNGKKVVDNSSEPSLLQKIINLLVEFFSELRVTINPTSHLQELHNTLGSTINFEESNPSFKGGINETHAAVEAEEAADIKDEGTSPVKEMQATQDVVVPEEFTTDEDKANYIKGYTDARDGISNGEFADSDAYIAGQNQYFEDNPTEDTEEYEDGEEEDGDESQFAGLIPSKMTNNEITKDEALSSAGFTTTEEAALNALADNPKNNPLGVSIATDMEQYLEQFPPQERDKIRAELNAGRLTYICR